MPGPSNARRTRNSKARGNKAAKQQKPVPSAVNVPQKTAAAAPESRSSDDESASPSPECLRTPSPLLPIQFDTSEVYTSSKPFVLEQEVSRTMEDVLCQEPFIYDPGNGPRVRVPKTFISSFFAQPPALDDPLCAEFAHEEVLEMLCTVLPEEMALVLWYNKSRSKSRVCPACQRLYRLGDVLPDHLGDRPAANNEPLPALFREQEISGLCSPVCFILASLNHPGAIKSAWGRMSEDIDDESWALLNSAPLSAPTSTAHDTSLALGMLVRMTRLHDLGLAQLCFDNEERELLEEAETLLEGLELE